MSLIPLPPPPPISKMLVSKCSSRRPECKKYSFRPEKSKGTKLWRFLFPGNQSINQPDVEQVNGRLIDWLIAITQLEKNLQRVNGKFNQVLPLSLPNQTIKRRSEPNTRDQSINQSIDQALTCLAFGWPCVFAWRASVDWLIDRKQNTS